MARWLAVMSVVVALGVAGCNASVKEIPPVKQAESGPVGDPRERAMKGMPEDMRKKYEAQKK